MLSSEQNENKLKDNSTSLFTKIKFLFDSIQILFILNNKGRLWIQHDKIHDAQVGKRNEQQMFCFGIIFFSVISYDKEIPHNSIIVCGCIIVTCKYFIRTFCENFKFKIDLILELAFEF